MLVGEGATASAGPVIKRHIEITFLAVLKGKRNAFEINGRGFVYF